MSVIADIELYDAVIASFLRRALQEDPVDCDVLCSAANSTMVAVSSLAQRAIIDRDPRDARRDVAELLRRFLDMQGRPDLHSVVLAWSITVTQR